MKSSMNKSGFCCDFLIVDGDFIVDMENDYILFL